MDTDAVVPPTSPGTAPERPTRAIRSDPRLVDDRHALYAELRSECPVAWDEDAQCWVLSRYDDVRQVFWDTKRFSNALLTWPPHAEPSGPRIPLQMDPPDHTVYRRLIATWFTAAYAQPLEPVARAASVEMIENLRAKGGGELFSEFARRLPVYIIFTWLGIPRDDWDLCMALDHQAVDPAAADAADTRGFPHYDAYLQTLLEERRRSGHGGDVLSDLAFAEVDGQPLSMEYMLRVAHLLFSAGIHTTATTLTNIVHYLATHPADRDRLTREPSLIPSAVEELMRYNSIVTLTRVATEDVEVRGCTIRAGEPLQLVLAAANRDETAFERAGDVVLDRDPNRHMQFGLGPHRCSGLPFARMELRVALEELHRLAPDYHLMAGKEVPRPVMGEMRELWIEL